MTKIITLIESNLIKLLVLCKRKELLCSFELLAYFSFAHLQGEQIYVNTDVWIFFINSNGFIVYPCRERCCTRTLASYSSCWRTSLPSRARRRPPWSTTVSPSHLIQNMKVEDYSFRRIRVEFLNISVGPCFFCNSDPELNILSDGRTYKRTQGRTVGAHAEVKSSLRA